METSLSVNSPNFYFKSQPEVEKPVEKAPETKESSEKNNKKVYMILGALAAAGVAALAISRGRTKEAETIGSNAAPIITSGAGAPPSGGSAPRAVLDEAARIAGEIKDRVNDGINAIESNPTVQRVVDKGRETISQIQQNPTVQKGVKNAGELAGKGAEAVRGLVDKGRETISQIQQNPTVQKGVKNAGELAGKGAEAVRGLVDKGREKASQIQQNPTVQRAVDKGRETISHIQQNPTVKKGVGAAKEGARRIGSGISSFVNSLKKKS